MRRANVVTGADLARKAEAHHGAYYELEDAEDDEDVEEDGYLSVVSFHGAVHLVLADLAVSEVDVEVQEEVRDRAYEEGLSVLVGDIDCRGVVHDILQLLFADIILRSRLSFRNDAEVLVLVDADLEDVEVEEELHDDVASDELAEAEEVRLVQQRQDIRELLLHVFAIVD